MWFCARSDGAKHGPFYTLFPDLKIEVSGTYKDDKIDGPWRRNHPNGTLAEEGTYISGVPTGAWRQLDASGGVLGEYKLSDGTGRQQRWLADGPLYSDVSLSKGVRHGAMRVLDRNGAIVTIAKYVGGKLEGKHLVGSKNTLRIEETFARGTRRGARRIWQFGALIVDENYDARGKLDGAFALWRERKVPRVQGTYDHGKRTGTWVWTDRNNKKEREGDYVSGKKSGQWSEWLDGKLLSQGTFTNDMPDGEFVYYDPKTGGELGRFTINGGTGTMLTFHPNKKAATKTRVHKGAMDGKYEELTPLGKTIVEGRYAGDRKHGLWREQTPAAVPTLEQTWKRGKLDGKVKKYVDGKLAVEATYSAGLAEGAYTEYRDGKPALSGQFAADKRTGTWTSYAPDGSVALVATYKEGVLDGPWKQVSAGVTLAGQMAAGRRSGTWTQTDRAGKTYSVSYKSP